MKKTNLKKRTKIALACVGTVLVVLAVGSAYAYRHFWPGNAFGRTATPVFAIAQDPSPPGPPSDPKTDRERLIAEAYKLRGIPYKFGGKNTEACDCSGFTKLAYEAIGVDIPDGSFNQGAEGEPLTSQDQLRPGDLLFYVWKGGKRISHVDMYYSDGWMIGTGSPGQKHEVSIYPLADDLKVEGATITYLHIALHDE